MVFFSPGNQKICVHGNRPLKIHNDILSSMDDGKITALILLTLLILLDFSAAFDTIDHTILLTRLDDWLGVNGKALDWLKSYLTGRSRRIKLGNCVLIIESLFRSPPRVSSWSSAFYTTPLLISLISGHAIPHYLYVDDSQLYISFSPNNSAAALDSLQSCLASVHS